jgi:hypothetical protein
LATKDERGDGKFELLMNYEERRRTINGSWERDNRKSFRSFFPSLPDFENGKRASAIRMTTRRCAAPGDACAFDPSLPSLRPSPSFRSAPAVRKHPFYAIFMGLKAYSLKNPPPLATY